MVIMVAIALTLIFSMFQSDHVLAARGTADNSPLYIVGLEGDVNARNVAGDHGLLLHSTYQTAFHGAAMRVPAGRLQALSVDPRVRFVVGAAFESVSEAESAAVSSVSTQTIPTGIRQIGAHLSPAAAIDGIDDRVTAAVAVMDTGVDGSHPDLNVSATNSASCVWGSKCVVGPAVDATGHGTHVAGTIAALDNDYGVVGVAPGAEIWSLQLCDVGVGCQLDAILRAHDYISLNSDSLVAVNVSLGGVGWSQAWREAIADNIARGVVVVVAAGNSAVDIYGGDGKIGNGNEYIPTAFPEVMTVSLMIDQDRL